MPEYLAPGVFVEEVDTGVQPIEGVSTTTTGAVGACVRGPKEGRPQLVTNMLQFRQRFGGPVTDIATGDLYYAAQGFFANGGRRLYVVRAVGAGAGETKFATQGGYVGRLAAGADAALTQPVLRPANVIGLADAMNLQLAMVRDGVTYSSANTAIKANGIDRATGQVTLAANIGITPAGPASYSARQTAVISEINGLNIKGEPTTGARPNSFTILAADVGAWGDKLVITAEHRAVGRAIVDGVLPANKIKVRSAAGFYVGAWIEIDRSSASLKLFRKVTAVNGNILTLATATVAVDVAPVAPATETIATVWEFALTATYDGITESFPSLTLENVPGKYAVDVVNSRSALIRIDKATLPADTHPFFFPSGADGLTIAPTTAGIDAVPNAAAIRGVDNGPGKRSGLRALEEIDEISMIVVPGWGDASVQDAMIEQCERLKYRVALLDPEVLTLGTAPTLTDIQNQRKRFDTKYAAVYYPRIKVPVADGGPDRIVGPSGHVAGICARVDIERGVWKAPGNEAIRNLTDLEVIVTRGEHEILNPQPNNINVLRDFRNEGRGLRVYGARCITSLSAWKYLSVRRLFIFVERSLDLGTQWAVLEPNDQRLWSRLIDSVNAFLTRLWRDGALLGLKKEQAFYVRCGLDTMTQDDIDNGRLIMEIGIAPVKPAEFVIMRITQKSAFTDN